MKKLSKTEAELKKSVASKKRVLFHSVTKRMMQEGQRQKTSHNQNQKQLRANINKKQHYRPNIAINHYQDNNNPHWQLTLVP